MTESPAVDIEYPQLQSEIDRCWPLAKAYWSEFLLLNAPEVSDEARSVAQIQLQTRQVALNGSQIKEYGLLNCVEALLAHEIGHHVRYPGTLAIEARMRMLERSILPANYSLTNVFQDLMINEQLGAQLKDQFIQIYQAFTSEPAFHSDMQWKRDPAFLFYLSLYEIIWQLHPGTLIGANIEPDFAEAFPGYRAEAAVVVNDLFRMEPNIYTQFLYFTSVMTRYLKPMIEEDLRQWLACQCAAAQPSADDWADALIPTDAERQAIERAAASGWFEEDQSERLRKLNELEERIASLPGYGSENASLIPEVMAAHYRQLAEQHLLKPPPLPRVGEAIVPTTLEEWELSDPIRDIDWMQTITQRGTELGPAQPLKRLPIAETEGFDVPLWQPRMEIYLDISGSMPNPIEQLNAMTLAAQILTLGTTRAGGSVRAALYSCEPVLYWIWCRSDVEMSRFLMHYVGAGTDFPFELLKKSCEDCRADQPIRVVISDADFRRNYDSNPLNREILVTATTCSPHFILLLHNPGTESVEQFESLGASVVNIEEFSDFPQMATNLTKSLFPDDPTTSKLML